MFTKRFSYFSKKKKKKSLEKFKELPWRYSNIGHCYSSEISYLKCMGLEKVG